MSVFTGRSSSRCFLRLRNEPDEAGLNEPGTAVGPHGLI